MTRPYLVLDHEQRDLTARYLKTFAAVERAHAVGDLDDLEHILGSVDPIDLRNLIAELESAATEPQPDFQRGVPHLFDPSLGSDESAPTVPRPSVAAASYPQVVHAFDTWSVKA